MHLTRIPTSLLTVYGLLLTAPLPSLAQGPLDPPGAPAPTMKTLEQVEPRTAITNAPFTINQSGSYYVTGNFVTTNTGITIETSNVTLDLMGFELVGGTGDGIFVDGALTNIVIRNGTVRDWSGRGIRAETAFGMTVERVTARLNGEHGIQLGDNAAVRDCAALENGENGIEIRDDGVVTRSTARGNGTGGFGSGFLLGASCTISESTAVDNAGDGIFASINATIQACTAQNNGGIGMAAMPGSTIGDSTASGNGSHGFQLEESGIIRHSNATGNSGHGIQTAFANVVIGCEAAFNTMHGLSGGAAQTIVDSAFIGNTLNGIALGGNGNTIRGCTVTDNTAIGIGLADESLIRECVVARNFMGGIIVGSGNTIEGCTLNANVVEGIMADAQNQVTDNLVNSSQDDGSGSAGRGIRITGDDSRIEGNHVSDAANVGIEVSGAANLVVRNSVRSAIGLHYNFAPGNEIGPIGDMATVGSEPWANFAF